MKISNNSLDNYPSAIKTSFEAKVHFLDGGNHANQMEHFAKSVFKSINRVEDMQMHEVECSSKAPALKKMDSIAEKIKELKASGKLKSGDYLSVLGLTPVPVLNLQDRVKAVLKTKTTINHRNVKAQQALLMRYLNVINDNPQKYSQEISYMDGAGQNIEYTASVIKLINDLKSLGVKVFLPAGHGADNTIKWLAGEHGVKNELYCCIARGKDENDDKTVSKLLKEADSKNYYDFNLLSLSDAHIVNLLGMNNRNYIFSAKDGFVNTSERGVYNFSPIRDINGKVLGYSFHDEKTVEVPVNEFHDKEKVRELNKFVGLQYRDVMSGYKDDIKYKKLAAHGASTSLLADKLYKITDVFDESEIERRKLNVLGFLIDREQKRIYDINKYGQIIFNKTNCEGSGRPSVYSMWGSCFATVNAIKNDILMCDMNVLSSLRLMLFQTIKNIKEHWLYQQ